MLTDLSHFWRNGALLFAAIRHVRLLCGRRSERADRRHQGLHVRVCPVFCLRVQKDIAQTVSRWKLSGRPMMCIILREENVRGEQFEQMMELLVALKNGCVDGVRVRVGRVQVSNGIRPQLMCTESARCRLCRACRLC
jgi:hypothetical protein